MEKIHADTIKTYKLLLKGTNLGTLEPLAPGSPLWSAKMVKLVESEVTEKSRRNNPTAAFECEIPLPDQDETFCSTSLSDDIRDMGDPSQSPRGPDSIDSQLHTDVIVNEENQGRLVPDS